MLEDSSLQLRYATLFHG